MLDQNLIGHSFGQRSIHVEEWSVRWYANAIGETDPIYSDLAAARAAGHRSLAFRRLSFPAWKAGSSRPSTCWPWPGSRPRACCMPSSNTTITRRCTWETP